MHILEIEIKGSIINFTSQKSFSQNDTGLPTKDGTSEKIVLNYFTSFHVLHNVNGSVIFILSNYFNHLKSSGRHLSFKKIKCQTFCLVTIPPTETDSFIDVGVKAKIAGYGQLVPYKVSFKFK